MPYSAPRECTYPGCTNLVESGRCEQHPYQQRRRPEALDINKLYKTARWRRLRLIVLRDNPLCVHCTQAGLVTQATEVDHIVPHKGDERLFWDVENLQGLCKPCHSKKTASEDGGFGNEY